LPLGAVPGALAAEAKIDVHRRFPLVEPRCAARTTCPRRESIEPFLKKIGIEKDEPAKKVANKT